MYCYLENKVRGENRIIYITGNVCVKFEEMFSGFILVCSVVRSFLLFITFEFNFHE